MSKQSDHSHMGVVSRATKVGQVGFSPLRARNVMLVLAISMALQMTSYAMIFPIFARRLGDFGSGVEALGTMAMAYSLTSIVASPFMGSLADRFGRRPLILGSLAVYVITFIGYLLATSTEMFIILRAAAGALTAGLGPAVYGTIADVTPESQRGRWIGIMSGGSAIGFTVGPYIGGVLYDNWGYVAPFLVSVVVAALALLVALIMVPETRSRVVRRRSALRQRRLASNSTGQAASAGGASESIMKVLPRPISTFGVLLFISFVAFFAWSFAEPQMMFYIFDDLGWTTAQFGAAAGAYGVASLLGQIGLGRLSDRIGRKPVLILGLILFSAQFVGLFLSPLFWQIAFSFLVAGLGEALYSPALSAFYLDITPEQHRSRVMGITGSAGSLGGLVGPALVVLATRVLPPTGIFLISGALPVIGAMLVFLALKEPERVVREIVDVAWDLSSRRVTAAQTALRAVVVRAASARETVREK